MQQNHATIKKNSFALCKKQQPKGQVKAEPKTYVAAEQRVSGLLYVTLRNREGDLQELFFHETQGYPPFLSDYGKRQACKQSDLLHCIGLQDEVIPQTYFDCNYCEYCGTLAQLIGKLLYAR